jgi:adenylate cyclase
VRQELSAPATAIMGYAEMLIDDAVLGGRGQFTDDLQRILDASRTLHRLILSLLDPATIHRTDDNADLAKFRRTLRHDLRTPINARQVGARKRSSPTSTSSWERQPYSSTGSMV